MCARFSTSARVIPGVPKFAGFSRRMHASSTENREHSTLLDLQTGAVQPRSLTIKKYFFQTCSVQIPDRVKKNTPRLQKDTRSCVMKIQGTSSNDAKLKTSMIRGARRRRDEVQVRRANTCSRGSTEVQDGKPNPSSLNETLSSASWSHRIESFPWPIQGRESNDTAFL